MEGTQQPDIQPQQSTSPIITETMTSNSFNPKGLYIAIAVVLILLVGGGVYALLRHSKTPNSTIVQQTTPVVSPTTALQPTPVISPVTSGNVDQTFDNTDTTMQQSVNQANTDLQSINGIDTSQDNTSGL